MAKHRKRQLSDLRNDNRGDLRSNWLAEAERVFRSHFAKKTSCRKPVAEPVWPPATRLAAGNAARALDVGVSKTTKRRQARLQARMPASQQFEHDGIPGSSSIV